jgi:hypothetical protein
MMLENNFTYTDIYKSGDPVERIKNNALENRGMIQNLFLSCPEITILKQASGIRLNAKRSLPLWDHTIRATPCSVTAP